MLIQKIQITALNKICTLLNKTKIGRPSKAQIIVGFFVVFFVFLIFFRADFLYNYLPRHIMLIVQSIGSVMIIIISALSVKERLSIITWNKGVYIPFFSFSISIIVSGSIHPIGDGFMSFGFMLLLIYPMLYIAWDNREDYETLFDYISIANIIAGALYFIYYCGILFSGNDRVVGGRHAGGMANANFYSFIGVSILCSALYLLYRFTGRKNKKKIELLYYLIFVTIGITFVFGGKSRSSIIICLTNIAVFVILFVKNRINMSQKSKRLLLISIGLAILLATVYLWRIQALTRFSTAGKTLDQFTSGRLRLWQSYLSKLNILGHDMNSVDWKELTAGIATRSAHNTFLEFSYRCGIITGLLGLAFQLVTIMHACYKLFCKKHNKDYEAFVIICIVHYTILSMVDIASIPLGSFGAFTFYLAVAPLFKRNIRKEAIYENRIKIQTER